MICRLPVAALTLAVLAPAATLAHSGPQHLHLESGSVMFLLPLLAALAALVVGGIAGYRYLTRARREAGMHANGGRTRRGS